MAPRIAPGFRKGIKLVTQSSAYTNSRTFASPTSKPRRVFSAAPPGYKKVPIRWTSEDALPPLDLLEADHASGYLIAKPENIMAFLRDYQRLSGPQATPGWEQAVCNKHRLDPATLSKLSMSLGKCEARAQKALARSLIHAASGLGDPAATLELSNFGFRSGKLDQKDYVNTVRHLRTLARSQNVQAMSLLGQILYNQGKEREALPWLQKAVARVPIFEGASDAYISLAEILQKQPDISGAREMLKVAALQLDDARAYFYLSKYESPGSAEQNLYLTKAALAGISEACHNLASIELSKLGDQSDKKASQREYGMAKEWYEVAAEGGFGLSMLNLASIYKSQGQRDKGLAWLKRAEALPEIHEQVANMMKDF